MKVLLVEDDTALAQALGEALGEAGLLWEHAATGHAADYLVRVESYDAVILDLGLPDGDGTRWLAAWREDGIDLPVLVLTARERWSDKAAGFSAGADDYVTKPFETAEVLFRLRALVRRSHGHAHPILRLGELALDTHTGSVTLAGRPITLTAQESRLLAYLLHAAPRIVSRIELSEHVYDRDHEPDSNVIDVQVSRLRRKLGNQRIVTLRGQGYRLVAPENEQ
ncbi:winged helix-turn-helix domain-containing protein [Chromohalobacter canadensis]|uniref:Response regulator transcription factor n=1 Tax=Chromohalobacter canadensis TaxID=141389 RepID=A0ABZ0Y7B5_9GAMM|nr:response regulator transcription factor [Chromohalobacter canadensis]MCK0768897.1 response regulator transcription factor [Chromohalobacter canadensis]MCT8467141.1 response regulator transcription factor [Chromohalobacter canadensis]MCT8471111.1 response regulator transcription factor [Chromohalobacter canadensis]MCT8497638.1 response regulator transcription factor [Chromohalobacter canadensis]WQH07951.1 response regulator transcription factor [Chromohalobacter canadensis]